MKRNKKVLMLATSRKTKGGITSVLNAYLQCPFWETYHIRWIETHIDKGWLLKFGYAIRAYLQCLFYLRQYDLVHIHVGELPSIKRKYFFYKLAHALKKKLVLHLHVGTQLAENKSNAKLRKMLDGSDAVLVLSHKIAQNMETLFGAKNVLVMPNPCPQVNNVTYTTKYKYILFAGTLNKNKGYETLIHAFSKLASKYADWKLVLAGNGEIDNVCQLSDKYEIRERVETPGWISGVQKDTLFRRATLFCLPSFAEGFPMSVLEAWAYGLPIVATPVGGLPDVLHDGMNAMLFEAGNVDELVDKLDVLMNDENRLSQMSEASLKLADEYRLSKVNEAMTSLYKRLLD